MTDKTKATDFDSILSQMSEKDKELVNRWPREVLERMHYAILEKQKGTHE